MKGMVFTSALLLLPTLATAKPVVALHIDGDRASELHGVLTAGLTDSAAVVKADELQAVLEHEAALPAQSVALDELATDLDRLDPLRAAAQHLEADAVVLIRVKTRGKKQLQVSFLAVSADERRPLVNTSVAVVMKGKRRHEHFDYARVRALLDDLLTELTPHAPQSVARR